MTAKILYGEADPKVLAAQMPLWQQAGYVVETAVGRQAIEHAVTHCGYDLVILGHTLNKDDRHHLPYLAKKLDPATRVLVLHASGKHPKVDIALDSRRGERVVLEAVAELLARHGQDAAAHAAGGVPEPRCVCAAGGRVA